MWPTAVQLYTPNPTYSRKEELEKTCQPRLSCRLDSQCSGDREEEDDDDEEEEEEEEEEGGGGGGGGEGGGGEEDSCRNLTFAGTLVQLLFQKASDCCRE